MQHETATPTETQSKSCTAQKLTYTPPSAAFVPLTSQERRSKPQKKGSFTVPLGCC